LLAAFEPNISPYIALAAFGFLVGLVGHIIRSNLLIVLGIALVFCAILVVPLVQHGNPYR
jgi:hypothetical protein